MTMQSWEEALASDLGATVERSNERADLLWGGGRWVAEVKPSLHGARDLHAAALSLSMYADGVPEARCALITSTRRVTAERIVDEWSRATSVLRPDVAARLVLVALTPSGDVWRPDDPDVQEVAFAARRTFPGELAEPASRATPSWSSKTLAVWMALLSAWLRAEPALPIQEIQRRAGASYPTVSAVLRRLEARGELARTSDRRAGLSGLPRRSLDEVVALGTGLRQTTVFHDRSGRSPDPDRLMRRLTAQLPEGAALGGVVAARYYTPGFDLNGVPRLDATVSSRVDLSTWVRSIDPALALAPAGARAALVVHRPSMAEPRVEPDARGVTYADPAEVLLDLHELRLTQQADDFIRALRTKAAA